MNTLPGRRWAVVGTLLLVISGCDDPIEPKPAEPELRPQVLLTWGRTRCRHPCGTQGVFGKVHLNVEVVDQNGDPWPDQMVHWRVDAGGGILGWYGARASDWPPPLSGADTAVSRLTSSSNNWRLGGLVGTQRVEAWVEGSDTVATEVAAVPGAIFVATVPNDMWFFDSIPSDTLRVHAADVDNIAHSAALLEEFSTVHLTGSVMPGTGFDRNWPFHLEPQSVRAARPDGFINNCVGLPWNEEGVQWAVYEAVFSWDRLLCQQQLHLVRIEEVPGWYLDEIRHTGEVAPPNDEQ